LIALAWCALAALAADTTSYASSEELAAGLHGRWQDAVADSAWVSPTESRRVATIEAAQALLQALPACEDRPIRRALGGMAAAGWEVSVHEVAGQPRVIVVEDDAGGGMYAWRCGPATPLVLQAPHTLYDEDTEALTLQMFVGTDARGLMWNTVHRYRATPDERPQDRLHPADVAHQPASLFQTWTLVSTAVWPDARVLQLHGFAGTSDGDGPAAETDVSLATGAVTSTDAAPSAEAPRHTAILSSGFAHLPPTGAATAVAAHLGALGRGVRVFGVNTELLGATTNAQARALVGGEGRRFLHLELSREARTWLLGAPGRPTALARALAEASWR
jgi:hypothetical protein